MMNWRCRVPHEGDTSTTPDNGKEDKLWNLEDGPCFNWFDVLWSRHAENFKSRTQCDLGQREKTLSFEVCVKILEIV